MTRRERQDETSDYSDVPIYCSQVRTNDENTLSQLDSSFTTECYKEELKVNPNQHRAIHTLKTDPNGITTYITPSTVSISNPVLYSTSFLFLILSYLSLCVSFLVSAVGFLGILGYRDVMISGEETFITLSSISIVVHLLCVLAIFPTIYCLLFVTISCNIFSLHKSKVLFNLSAVNQKKNNLFLIVLYTFGMLLNIGSIGLIVGIIILCQSVSLFAFQNFFTNQNCLSLSETSANDCNNLRYYSEMMFVGQMLFAISNFILCAMLIGVASQSMSAITLNKWKRVEVKDIESIHLHKTTPEKSLTAHYETQTGKVSSG